jgi:hypothetical protein
MGHITTVHYGYILFDLYDESHDPNNNIKEFIDKIKEICRISAWSYEPEPENQHIITMTEFRDDEESEIKVLNKITNLVNEYKIELDLQGDGLPAMLFIPEEYNDFTNVYFTGDVGNYKINAEYIKFKQHMNGNKISE